MWIVSGHHALLARRWRTALAAVAGLVLLSGCATSEGATSASIDWAKLPVVQMRIAVDYFFPQQVNLKLGQPVRLVFYNDGGTTHDFVTAFFATAEVRPNGVPPGERVILQPEQSIEYDVIPKVAGDYSVSSIMLIGADAVPPADIIVR